MKNKKTIIKLGIFLFGVSLFLSNCEKNEINEVHQTIKETTIKSNYSVSEIGVSEAQRNTSLIQKLDELTKKKKKSHNKNTHSKSVYSSEYDFTVNTDFGKYLESSDGTYHSYTFPVTRETDNGLLENLLVTLQLDGSYKLFLISYNINEKEKQEFLEGKYINFKDKVNYTKINTNLLGQLFSKESISCVDIYYTYCGEGNHPGGMVNGGACPAQSMSMRSWCEYSGGGPATGGDDISTNDDEQDHHDNYAGSGGTSNNDNNTSNEEEQIITVPIVPSYEQQIGSCFLSSYGNVDLQAFFNIASLHQKKDAAKFLKDNTCSEDARNFVEDAIEAIIDGAEVDFDEQIIIEKDF
jgi:hypothetical protein